jgi:hypothetical protein
MPLDCNHMTRTRRDEEFAQEALTRFFAERFSIPSVWEPDSQPPDFWVYPMDRRFAVEVTQLMESVEVGAITLTQRGANAALRSAVRKLEALARAAGLLQGFYHIHVCPLPAFRAVFPELQTRLLAYLISSRLIEKAAKSERVKEAIILLLIDAYHYADAKVGRSHKRIGHFTFSHGCSRLPELSMPGLD